ncbi:hypothetical protein EVAR_101401_1 [Eumeta japonica]|uniref:Uncharacterized protein n=1 Tax=Eumeta variegata TaxID=151549 RepID=A0A4C1TH03_EUMVA|nr:hypothetical protein EVAR_101401_1 [Eumeta japonica]
MDETTFTLSLHNRFTINWQRVNCRRLSEKKQDMNRCVCLSLSLSLSRSVSLALRRLTVLEWKDACLSLFMSVSRCLGGLTMPASGRDACLTLSFPGAHERSVTQFLEVSSGKPIYKTLSRQNPT